MPSKDATQDRRRSPWNEVDDLAPRRSTNVYDSTLRKLLLMPSITPTVSQMLATAESLAQIGVKRIILNVFYNGDTEPNELEFEVCKALLSRDFGFEVSVSSDAFVTPHFLRNTSAAGASREALRRLADVGMTNCAILGVDPMSSAGRAELQDELAEAYAWCASQGIDPVLNVTDVGRYDFEFLMSLTRDAIAAGVVRIDAHDSVSSFTPEGASRFATSYLKAMSRETEVVLHSHNDFGLASASAIAATVAGFAPDVSLLGVSYRSGLAALEEVCLSLEWFYGIETGIDLGGLTRAARELADRFGFAIDPLKPVVGRQQFMRQLPLWNIPYFDGAKAVASASAHDPGLVGGEIEVVWNRSRSIEALRAKARFHGLSLPDGDLAAVSGEIGAELEESQGPPWVSDDLVLALLQRRVERHLS